MFDSAQCETILDFRKFQFSDSAQCDTARSHVFREYLRENEFFSETILDCLSGTQMGSIHEKINHKKSHDTASSLALWGPLLNPLFISFEQ